MSQPQQLKIIPNKMSLTEEVEDTIQQLRELQFKSATDAELISLLELQNGQLAKELTTIRDGYEARISVLENTYEKSFIALRQERDLAVRKAKEVQGVIENIGRMALAGVNKMRGDFAPEPVIEPPFIREIGDQRLPANAL